MKRFKLFQIGAVALVLSIASSLAAAVVNPAPGWADSYSVNGKCYCATTYDHGIGNFTVSTPAGTKTVREVCTKIGPGPGKGNNPVYNTVQCGHPPGHYDKAVRDSNGVLIADEQVCPGRVDQGPNGCNNKGPKWDLSVFETGGGGSGNGTYPCSNNDNNSAQCKNATGNSGAWCNVWNNGTPKNICYCGGSGACTGNTDGGGSGGGTSDTFPCLNTDNQSAQCKQDTGKSGAWCNIWSGESSFVCNCGGSGPCKR